MFACEWEMHSQRKQMKFPMPLMRCRRSRRKPRGCHSPRALGPFASRSLHWPTPVASLCLRSPTLVEGCWRRSINNVAKRAKSAAALPCPHAQPPLVSASYNDGSQSAFTFGLLRRALLSIGAHACPLFGLGSLGCLCPVRSPLEASSA